MTSPAIGGNARSSMDVSRGGQLGRFEGARRKFGLKKPSAHRAKKREHIQETEERLAKKVKGYHGDGGLVS